MDSEDNIDGSWAPSTGIACPSYGRCVAVGSDAAGASGPAAVMVETAPGQWGQPIALPEPSDVDTSGGEITTSVACSSATSCMAVGLYNPTSLDPDGTQPFEVPFTLSGSSVSFGVPEAIALPGDALTTSDQEAFSSAVSCGSGGCVAVGAYLNSGSVWEAFVASPGAGGTWTATTVPAPAGATDKTVLNAISCPNSGPCEAVGDYADSAHNVQYWAVQVTSGVAGTAQPVTIPNAQAVAALVPTAPSTLSIRQGLDAVSCPSAGACVAAGDVAMVTPRSTFATAQAISIPITAGTPGPDTAVPANPVLFPYLSAISCSDTSDCVAVGFQGNFVGDPGTFQFTTEPIAATETAGTWSTPVILQGVGVPLAVSAAVYMNSLDCSSPGVCVAGGITWAFGVPPSTQYTAQSFFSYSALPPAVTTNSLPAATVGRAYSATLQSSGGTGTGSWSISTGSLPAGLTLNAAAGVISGTPTAGGQDNFVATVTNTGPPSLSANQNLSITVSAVASGTVASGTVASGTVASVKIASTQVSGDIATARISCSGAYCRGKYTLTGVEHARNGAPTAVVARAHAKQKKAKPRMITLASGSYSVNVGATKAIKIKLNHKAMTLLRRLHKISGKLTLTPTGAKTPVLVKKLTFKSGR